MLCIPALEVSQHKKAPPFPAGLFLRRGLLVPPQGLEPRTP